MNAVGAEAELFNDVSVGAQLVSKLSASQQDRWHQDKTSTDFLNDQRKTGGKFLGWIERHGAAAVSARLTHQALALSKQQQSAPPVQKCGVCGKGKLWEPNRDQRASLEQEIAGNAFAASRRTYPSGQGTETSSR